MIQPCSVNGHEFNHIHRNEYICKKCKINVIRYADRIDGLFYDVFYLNNSTWLFGNMRKAEKLILSCNEYIIKNIIE